jgi:hypothetical protein
LSFALERIGPLAAIIIIVFYLLILYLSALPNTPKNLFAGIYSESLIKTTCQYLLLLVGFDTLIYQKYYNTPPILVGHQTAMVVFMEGGRCDGGGAGDVDREHAVVVVKQHMPWDGLNGGRTRCWRIRERGTS